MITLEFAEQEFERFVELMDLDLDPQHMDDDDRDQLEKHRRVIVRAIQSGHVSVDEAGQPTIHLKRPPAGLTTITCYEPTGRAFLSMDAKKKTQEVSKMYSMIQTVTGTPEGTCSQLFNRDLKVLQAISLLFLA